MCQHIHVYICIMYTCIHPFFLFVKVCNEPALQLGNVPPWESSRCLQDVSFPMAKPQSHSWHPKFFSQKRMVQHATTIDNPQLFRLICGFTLELPSTQGQFNLIHVAAGVQDLAIVPCCELWQTGLCCSKTFEQLYSLTSIFVSKPTPSASLGTPSSLRLWFREHTSALEVPKALPKYQRHLSDSCSNSFGSVWVCLEISGNRTIMNHIPQNCLFEWENDDWW